MPRASLIRSVFGRVTLSSVLVSLVSTLLLFMVVQRIVVADGRSMLAREVDGVDLIVNALDGMKKPIIPFGDEPSWT